MRTAPDNWPTSQAGAGPSTAVRAASGACVRTSTCPANSRSPCSLSGQAAGTAQLVAGGSAEKFYLWDLATGGAVLARGTSGFGTPVAGELDLAAGDHVLKLECLGKGERSAGHFLAIDAFTLKPAGPR